MSDTPPRRPAVVITAILGLALVGLASVTLVARLGRFWWFADLASHFTLYYAVGGGLLLAASVLLKRRRLAVLTGLCLAVNTAVLWPQYGMAAVIGPQGDPGSVLRLAHINVLYTNRDTRAVLRFIRNSGADVVFVQEVNARWDAALKRVGAPYRVALSAPREGAFGLAALVRDDVEDDVKLLDAKLIDLTHHGDGRPSIEVLMRVAGREVSVLSVHTLPPVNAGATALRDTMLRHVRAWSDRQTTPHVVIGDLNTTPWSYAFSILAGDGGLVSTQRGRGNQGSWPTSLPMPWLLPIDHCLYSPGLVCLDRRIGPDIGSDHLPLTVSISLTSADKYQADRPIPSYPDTPDSPRNQYN